MIKVNLSVGEATSTDLARITLALDPFLAAAFPSPDPVSVNLEYTKPAAVYEVKGDVMFTDRVTSPFTEAELAEADELEAAEAAIKADGNYVPPAATPGAPTPAEVFGAGKSADAALSSAGVETSPTALERTTADTLTPAETSAPLPPVVSEPSGVGLAAPPTGLPADSAILSTVTTDKDGLPWDSRIHSKGKTFIANGTWKRKRGVSAEIIAEVEANLRAVMSAPTPTAEAPSDTVAPPPPSSAARDGRGFPSLMQLITSAQVAKTLTAEQVNRVLADSGVPNLPSLASRPDLVPGVLTKIEGLING